MSQSPIVSRTFLHSNYIRDIGNGEDAVVVSEILERADGTTEPALRRVKSPRVPFWITKEGLRGHPNKKEFENLDNLDEYIVIHKDKDKEIFKILNGYYPNFITRSQRNELYKSPYLYGGNIDVEALISMSYKKNLAKVGKIPQPPTTGFFDIEKSLLPSSFGKLPMMVFTAENRVYLAMKKSFMVEPRGKDFVEVTVDDVRAAVHHHLDPLIKQIFDEKGDDLKDHLHKLPITYEFFVGDTEVEMIKWIFDKMHESKTSFIGVWNISFDIGEVIKVLEEAGIPLEEVFADPSLRGTGYANAYFKEDKKKHAHITQKRHWMNSSSFFQFVDSTCLYSYIRVVDGKEPSYKLGVILEKYGLGGKLKVEQTEDLEGLQEPDWHREMLSKHFINYAVYCIWDALGLQMLEWLNNDLTAMVLLTDTTPPGFFPKQTIRVTNTLFEDWKPEREILGTGVDIEEERDDELEAAGGAVLAPLDLTARGVCLFKEWPNHHTQCYLWQNDFDFSAQYPSNIKTLNISKQTKISTIFAIKAEWVNLRYDPTQAIEVFCSYMATPKANGVELGVEFLNLPDYAEMDKLFKQKINA